MIEKLDKELLEILADQGETRLIEILEKLKVPRSTLLYRASILIQLKIISQGKSGKHMTFKLGEVHKYIHDKRIEIAELESLIETGEKKIAKPKILGDKLKLTFVNYLDFSSEAKEKLEEYYQINDFSESELHINDDEFVYRSRDSEVIVNNWASTFTNQLLERLPKLQYMHVTTFQTHWMDTESLSQKGVDLSIINEDYRESTLVEFLIYQTYNCFRGINEAKEQFKSNVFDYNLFQGEVARGKTVGILCSDHLAFQLSQILKILGFQVMILDTSNIRDPRKFGISRFSTLQEIVLKAEIIYFTNSNNKRTPIRDLDKSFFRLLKKPIHIISVEKHNFIDYEVVRKMLLKGLIKTISLDYVPELASMHSLKGHAVSKVAYFPNVSITPDIAWYTHDSVRNVEEYSVNALIAYAKGDRSYLLL